MQGKLKSTVLRLSKDNIYIHFCKIKKYNKFGYQALFKNQQLSTLYDILYFSKPLLQVNTMNQHLQHIIGIYKSLNSKIVTPIIQIIDKSDSLFIVSKGYEFTLSDLVIKRQGLTDFQIAYFLVDTMQLMSYLRKRDCLFEKLELDDIFLNQDQKIAVTFNLFLNQIQKKPVIKRLPFRHQYRNRNNCPDLFFNNTILPSMIEEINSWNLGIFLFQLLQNKRPFNQTNQDLISQSKNCSCSKDIFKVLKKQYQLSMKDQDRYPQLNELIKQLLKPNSIERMKFNLIVIHPFLKMFPTPPHILPTTIFSCPPSQNYKEQYFKKFLKEERCKGTQSRENRINAMGDSLMRSHKQFKQPTQLQIGNNGRQVRQDKQIKTQHQIQESERTLSQNNVYIDEFVDISDSFGFGYQMNSGTVCFVFNDETEYYYSNGNLKEIRTRHRSKKYQEIIYQHDKLPEEEDIRKKIHILQAFAKNLKRNKAIFSEKDRTVTVEQYCRTKYASLFLLSNNSVQIFFNDKINYILNKNNIQVQLKNCDKYERYDLTNEEQDLQIRKQYCLTMAHKIFLWQSQQDEHILNTQGLNIDFQN